MHPEKMEMILQNINRKVQPDRGSRRGDYLSGYLAKARSKGVSSPENSVFSPLNSVFYSLYNGVYNVKEGLKTEKTTKVMRPPGRVTLPPGRVTLPPGRVTLPSGRVIAEHYSVQMEADNNEIIRIFNT